MAENSKIEWCDHTINFWQGCTKVSAGCRFCYAENVDKRFGPTRDGQTHWGAGAPRIQQLESARKLAMKWNAKAVKNRKRYKIFSNSMSDWLDLEVPVGWLAAMLETIRLTPHLDWLLLTKRPEFFCERVHAAFRLINSSEADIAVNEWLDGSPLKNVWIGTSVEDQTTAGIRIESLLDIPALVHFISAEPLLGPVDLREVNICDGDALDPYLISQAGEGSVHEFNGVNWVICGGESGPKARPMEIEWARALRSQCEEAGIAFFMKQIGGVRDKRGKLENFPQDLRVREFPNLNG